MSKENNEINFKKNWKSKLKYKSNLIKLKNIENRNKKFHSLSRSERRREIALDVLSMLDSNLISASYGSYWDYTLQDATENTPPPSDDPGTCRPTERSGPGGC